MVELVTYYTRSALMDIRFALSKERERKLERVIKCMRLEACEVKDRFKDPIEGVH